MIKILLVEDEVSEQRIVKSMIDLDPDINLIIKNDGVEGWAYFQKRHESLDMVISDLQMPRMDGEELVQKIKKLRPDMIVCGRSHALTFDGVDGRMNKSNLSGQRFLEEIQYFLHEKSKK